MKVMSGTITQPNDVSAQPRMRVRPALLWAIVAPLCVLGALQVLLAWGEIVSSGMDIQQDYIAGKRLLAGGDIYAPIAPAEVSALGVHEEYGVGMRQNVHPPPTALVFAALALLPFPLAALLWTLGSVVLLFGAAGLLARELALPIGGPWRLIGPLLLLNWYPVWLHLHDGQFTILLLALVAGAWWCERRGYAWLAGALLGAAAVLKIYPALLLAYALLRRRWRVLGGAALVMLALAAAGPQQWADYFTRVAPANAAEWMPNLRNASLASISMRLFAGSAEVRPFFAMPWLEPPLRALLYALAGGLLAYALWRQRRADDLAAGYSLCVCAMALLAPLTWDHAFIFLLMPFGYIWREARADTGRWRGWAIGLMIAALALSLFPTELVFVNLKRAYQLRQMPPWVHFYAVGVWVMLCGYAATLLASLRRRAS